MLRAPSRGLLLCLLLGVLAGTAYTWNEWKYRTTFSTDPDEASARRIQWNSFWTSSLYSGELNPPRARRGHSLHLIKTDPRSEYNGETYVLLFGGRDNNQKAVHIPRTYNVETINGSLEFTTYTDKPVNACDDPEGQFYSAEERGLCNGTTSVVDVGLFYNDVWAYKLCSSITNNDTSAAGVGVPPEEAIDRDFDGACNSTGWELWHPGANEGGCVIELGIEVCTVPSERYNHASVMFNDGTLYVYGGFSQRCQDYCDDLWFFDIYMKGWREVYGAGKLTNFYTDIYLEETIQLDPANVPVDSTSSAFAGPGRRWRHTMSPGKEYFDPVDGRAKQQFALYGGHRLWHGYSQENNQENNWANFITRPRGGYLDDLWIYTKILDFGTPGLAFKTNNGLWEKKEPAEQCFPNPGISWESRFDIACTTVKPTERAGHGSAFDFERNIVWIFGGYTTYYPYIRTDGSGSGPGVTSVGAGGFVPYPGYDYFRNDLWYYNLTSSLWIEVSYPPDNPAVPDGRTDMIFLLLGDVLFMHGGFADNYIFDDTWYFNITTSRWLQKTRFVRPIYPDSCTDDFEYIAENNCTQLLWPKHIERAEDYPFEILPYYLQPDFWPDPQRERYFGILPKDYSEGLTAETEELLYNQFAPDGTPIFPYAATGLLQFAKPFFFSFNSTHNATLVESCTSVFAEPTRGKILDGEYGRSDSSILIPQPRPRKPGWDGCRDRFDGRTELQQGLQYVQPLPRFSHRAIFIPNTSEILMYGGMAYNRSEARSLSATWYSDVRSDMWYYSLNHCVNNCSFHGDCFFGFCQCHTGYYGEDCSNISCPGTYCYYNPVTFEQVCEHACHAGYLHTDTDTYVQDIAKVPCSEHNTAEERESNGICNGFGSVQCAPPFIGDDCSIKDCKNNCSFNGWCSVEYPVSRCMCVPGYFGDICEKKLCLNNCSYPNGVCNETSGACICRMKYSPYNISREFQPWAGEDCSYHFPYSAAHPGGRGARALLPLVGRLFSSVYRSLLLRLENAVSECGAMQSSGAVWALWRGVYGGGRGRVDLSAYGKTVSDDGVSATVPVGAGAGAGRAEARRRIGRGMTGGKGEDDATRSPAHALAALLDVYSAYSARSVVLLWALVILVVALLAAQVSDSFTNADQQHQYTHPHANSLSSRDGLSAQLDLDNAEFPPVLSNFGEKSETEVVRTGYRCMPEPLLSVSQSDGSSCPCAAR